MLTLILMVADTNNLLSVIWPAYVPAIAVDLAAGSRLVD